MSKQDDFLYLFYPGYVSKLLPCEGEKGKDIMLLSKYFELKYSCWQSLFCVLTFLNVWLGGVSAQTSLQFQNFTQKDGLSSNYILSIQQDYQGFIWVGTENGLNRLDGQNILQFRFDPEDPETLDDNWVITLFEDSRQQLWIGTNQGLHRLDRENGKIRRVPLIKDKRTITNAVHAIREDQGGNLWIVTVTGGLYHLKSDRKYDQADHFAYGAPFINTSQSLRLFDLVYSNSNELWLLTSAGLDRLNIQTRTIDRFPFPNREAIFDGDFSGCSAIDYGNGSLLVQLQGQFYRLDTQDPKPQLQLFNTPADIVSKKIRFSRQLPPIQPGKPLLSLFRRLAFYDVEQNELEFFRGQDGSSIADLLSVAIHVTYQDRQGNYWIGTAGQGLFLGQSGKNAYTFYQKKAGGPNTLSNGPVRTIVEDGQGKIWVGIINRGLDVFSLDEHGFLQKELQESISPNPQEASAINKVIKLIQGPENSIWLASNTGGLLRIDSTRQNLTQYTHQATNPNSISADRIWALTTDQEGNIWAGTWLDGLNRLDPISGEITNFRHDPDDPNSLISDNIRYLLFDEQGFLWIGTTNGLDRYDPRTMQFTHFRNEPNNPGSLSENMVWAIYQDHEQNIWVGTDVGLNRYNPETNQFEHFFEKDGLPDHTIYGILEDDDGVLWVSTENGLARQLPSESKVTFFPMTLENELETVAFLPKAYWNNTQNSQLYFGSTDGLLVVDPLLLKLDTLQPIFSIHSVHIFNPFTEEESITDYFPKEGKKVIRMGYHDQSITFSIADLNWMLNKNWQYQYQLVGFDRNWMPLAHDMQVSFSNLKPKKYQLMIRAVNAENQHSEKVLLSEVVVYPPWWKSTWAYLLYILAVIGLVFLVFHDQLRRQLKKREADNLRVLDNMKNQLFTNITHEFRTPLTIITGMIDQVEKKPERWLNEGAEMIRKNSNNLLDLVNQILELQKLESGKLVAKKQLGDIIPFLETIFRQFQAFAQSKEQEISL